jgi:hypothetical protein
MLHIRLFSPGDFEIEVDGDLTASVERVPTYQFSRSQYANNVSFEYLVEIDEVA